MKKLLLLSFVFTLLSFFSFAQTTFQKVYGGEFMDNGNSVRKTNDNGYFIVGTTTSYGSGGRDILAIKTNYAGDTLWTRTFGGDIDNEYGFCGQQTSDGGYIISGVASSFDDVGGDVYVIKLNSNGDTSWTRTYGSFGYEWGSFIQQTTDGGYIVIGQTPIGAGGFDAYLIKLSSTGNISWTKTYGGTGLEIGYAVQQTADGGYIITGQIDTYGAGGGDFLLIKTDASGTAIWKKAYGTANSDEAGVSVKQTSDGGYLIGGSAAGATTGSIDMCLIKTDANGNISWSKTYGGNLTDECNEVIQTTDGGYILIGRSFSFSTSSDYDIYVVKTNNQGDVSWSKTYGSSGSAVNNDFGYSIQQTSDGGYIMTGESFGFGAGIKNMYLIKTDVSGNSGCNQGVPATISATFSAQINDAPIETNSGGNISYPATIVSSGSTKTLLCENIPLSINLIDLHVKKISNSAAKLVWSTLGEDNNLGFEVHRSFDGSTFEKIAFVNGHLTTSQLHHYSHTDFPEKIGTVYYRLKQKDRDGNSTHTKVISVTFDNNHQVHLFPNPAQKYVTIEGIEPYHTIQIMEGTGKIFEAYKTDFQYSIKMNLEQLSNGFYLVKLMNDLDTQYHQLVINN